MVPIGKKPSPGDHESSLKLFLEKLFLQDVPVPISLYLGKSMKTWNKKFSTYFTNLVWCNYTKLGRRSSCPKIRKNLFYCIIYIYRSYNKYIYLYLSTTQLIWLSSNTPGSGWGDLAFESRSYQKLKIALTAPQPVLVIISLSKGNALAIIRCSSCLIQWTSRQRLYNSKS